MPSQFVHHPIDGRPLFRYRLSIHDYQALQRTLKNAPNNPDHANTRHHALFCLFAAEWFRREYNGNARQWEPIFNACGVHLNNTQRSEWVSGGLIALGRPLLTDFRGKAYLNTLVIEGGMPLGVLLERTGRFRRFLEQIWQLQRSHNADTVAQWRALGEEAKDELPTTLNKRPIWASGAELARVIWRYSEAIPAGAVDPVAHLNQRHPHWQDELPFLLEDDRLNSFLTQLLSTSGRIRRTPAPHANTVLFQFSASFCLDSHQLQRRPQVPRRFSTSKLKSQLLHNTPDLSNGRYLLVVHDETTTHRVGFIDVNTDRCTFSQSQDLCLTSESTLTFKLLRRKQEAKSIASAAGGESLIGQPLVFDRDTLTLIASGPVHTACTRLLIGLPLLYSTLNTPIFSVGGRNFFELKGEASLVSTCCDERLSFRSGAPSRAQITLLGPTFRLGDTRSRPVYKGWPSASNNGVISVKNKNHWIPINQVSPLPGQYRIRVLSPAGETLHTQTIAVVPSDFDYAVVQGRIDLHFTAQKKPSITATPNATVTLQNNTVNLRFGPDAGQQNHVHLTFSSPSPATPLCLAFPSPVSRLAFTQLTGQPYPHTASLPLSRLGQVRISAWSNQANRRFYLRVIGVPELATSRWEVFDQDSLVAFEAIIDLALTQYPHPWVTLELTQSGQSHPPRIVFSRYDWSIQDTGAHIQLTSAGTFANVIHPNEHTRASFHPLECLASATPLHLSGVHWHRPSTDHNGLLTATCEGAHRAQPLLFRPHPLTTQEVLFHEADRLAERIEEALNYPAENGLHSLFQQIDQLFSVDLAFAETTTLYQAIQDTPRAQATLALYLALSGSMRLFEGLERHPFSWDLIPTQSWADAVHFLAEREQIHSQSALVGLTSAINAYTSGFGLALWGLLNTEIPGIPVSRAQVPLVQQALESRLNDGFAPLRPVPPPMHLPDALKQRVRETFPVFSHLGDNATLFAPLFVVAALRELTPPSQLFAFDLRRARGLNPSEFDDLVRSAYLRMEHPQ